MEDVETYQHAGMTIEIGYDPMPTDANPRDFDGNVGVMLCGHRRYNLGDEQIDGDDFTTAVTCPSCSGSGENHDRAKLWRRRSYGWEAVGAGSPTAMQSEMSREIARKSAHGELNAESKIMVEICDCPRCAGGQVEIPLAAYLKQERGASVILPLGLIDHSGISMYVGAGSHRHDPGGWDSGQVGVIFDTTATREECGLEDASREEIEKALQAEVRAYAEYLRGEVYCFTVTDPDGEHRDSCGGFLGDLDYVRSQANESALAARSAARRERRENHAMACRDIETV